MWLLLAFLLVPLIEIGLFIQIGGILTLWPTLGIVVLTAIIGTWLVRTQGLKALQDLRGSMEEMRDPSQPLVHGAMILFAGALLLTPGFLTDAIGFSLLIPRVRVFLFEALRARFAVQTFSLGPQSRWPNDYRPAGQDDVIEGVYEETDNDTKSSPDGRNSPWRNH